MSDTLDKKFKALADKNRLKILLYLKRGNKTAGKIAKQFSVSAPTISYHLSILENSGLIFSWRVKGYIYYSIKFSEFNEIIDWLKTIHKI